MKINNVNHADFDDTTIAVTATSNGTGLMLDKPDYSHIVKDSTVTIEITSEEASAIFYAYDRGFDALDDESKRQIDVVFEKLKYELWP